MLTSPLSVHFEVTDSCNNACPHCYGSSWVNLKARSKPQPIEVARKIVQSHIFEAVITGGEPLLLGKDSLQDLFTLFHNHNIQSTLNTNGRLLNADTCRFLKGSGLNTVLISLHSWINELHDEIVNAPHAAMETKLGIQNALQVGLQVVVNQVIDKRNVDTMHSSALALEKFGVRQISFTRALSPLNGNCKIEMIDAIRFLEEYIKCKENLRIPVVSLLPIPFCADPRVKDLKKNLHCTGGVSTAVVSCNGDVRFCPHDTQVWGNLLQEDLASIWRRMAEWRKEVAVPGECKACSFVADCHGGCRVAAKLCYNDYAAKDPWARGAVTNYKRKVIFSEFDPDALYVMPSEIRWRKENEAFLLFYEGSRMLVNSDGIEFAQRLPHRFVPAELLKESSDRREMQMGFLKSLYYNGLLLSEQTK